MKTTKSKVRIISTVLVSAFVLSAGVASAHRGHGGPGARHGAAMFDKADTNKDEKISRTEAKSMHDGHFKKLDTNNDGSITREEAKAAMEKMRAEMKKQHGEQGKQNREGRGEHKGKGGREGKVHAGGGFFKHFDTNQDGKITRAEADKVEVERFNAVDTNKDGAITKAEIQAHFAAKRAEWKEKHAAKKGNEGQKK